MASDKNLLEELRERGLIAQQSAEGELEQHLQSPQTIYCGFDPTADSLHIGSLVPLLMLRRFQNAGHKPIALVGGSTGLIGDPSFKANERQLNGAEIVEKWCARLKEQMRHFIDFDAGGLLENNFDWTGDMSVLDFMRDVGKNFSINSMIRKESVKQRIEREGSGISFTEFSYMLLQSWDFVQLNKRHGCTIQIGGSDQWGNITAGIDLTRRMNKNQVYGITTPLITKADGTKFGKTETGTVWLDPKKTSPYGFYQFWLKTADDDVYNFLRYFTFLSCEEIRQIELDNSIREGAPYAQRILAEHVTELVHSKESLEGAKRITQALFSGENASLTEADYEQLVLDGLPVYYLENLELAGKPFTTILTETGLAKSGKQVKDALDKKAVNINGIPLSSSDNMRAPELLAHDSSFYGKYHLVKLGKKKYQILVL